MNMVQEQVYASVYKAKRCCLLVRIKIGRICAIESGCLSLQVPPLFPPLLVLTSLRMSVEL